MTPGRWNVTGAQPEPQGGADMTHTTTTCPCRELHDIDNAEHDRLTGLEASGTAGILDLFLLVDLRMASQSVAGQLDPTEIVTFVGQHDWDDPYAMYELARLALARCRPVESVKVAA